MENTTNSDSNQNDGPRPNPNMNSIDGFSRPSQPQVQTSPNNDAVVSSISIPPSNTNDTDSGSSSQSQSSHDSEAAAPVLSAPITTGGMDHKKSKIWTIILIILLLVVFVGGIYGVYAYQQKKIDSLNKQVTELTSQNALLKKQIDTAKAAPSVNINTQTNSPTLTVVKIPELGVSFTVPANLADLTYVMNSSKTQANLSSQNLATLDAACTASATVAPLGSVVKANGQYPTTTSATTTLIKQYPTYYIAYVKPATACSKIAQVNTFANVLMADFAKTYSTIALIST